MAPQALVLFNAGGWKSASAVAWIALGVAGITAAGIAWYMRKR